MFVSVTNLKFVFETLNSKNLLTAHWGQLHWDQRNTPISEREAQNLIINQA